MLYLLILLAIQKAEADTATQPCANLTCINEPPGQLMTVDVFTKRERKQMQIFVCERTISRCEYDTDFFGSQSKKCNTVSEPLTVEACRRMGTDRNSLDGALQRRSKTIYSTHNHLHEDYAWMRTLADHRYNSILELHIAETNGTVVFTGLDTVDNTCYHAMGGCKMQTKVIAWTLDPICMLAEEGNVTCHTRGLSVVCPAEDYDIIGNISMCSQTFKETTQGAVLRINTSNEATGQHRIELTAAVIQHVMDRLESLERQILCLSTNAHCNKEELPVRSGKHYSFWKFFKPEINRDIDEGSIDETESTLFKTWQGVEQIGEESWWHVPHMISWIKIIVTIIMSGIAMASLAYLIVKYLIPLVHKKYQGHEQIPMGETNHASDSE